jgi:glycosyltransferase involved in cell wall biosynthesis
MTYSSKHSPFVSVVMPVFNGDLYLAEAIHSILDQTFFDSEFIIIDDGSTDRTNDIISSFSDKRIVLYKNSLSK